jgi:hypothetical protein
MTGIAALSGFLLSKHGNIWAFSILINNGSAKTEENRALENEIIAVLLGLDNVQKLADNDMERKNAKLEKNLRDFFSEKNVLIKRDWDEIAIYGNTNSASNFNEKLIEILTDKNVSQAIKNIELESALPASRILSSSMFLKQLGAQFSVLARENEKLGKSFILRICLRGN